MKKTMTIIMLAMMFVAAAAGAALATFTSQIWIPSTDIQPFADFHLDVDSYIRASSIGKSTGNPNVRDPNVWDIGPVIGILPFQKLQAEVGFDVLLNATSPNDNHPVLGRHPRRLHFQVFPGLSRWYVQYRPFQLREI